MALAMYCTVTTTSVIPWRLSRLRICSMTGRPTIGTIGFGRETVSGLNREPSPPAITTAFITPALPHHLVASLPCSEKRKRYVINAWLHTEQYGSGGSRNGLEKVG